MNYPNGQPERPWDDATGLSESTDEMVRRQLKQQAQRPPTTPAADRRGKVGRVTADLRSSAMPTDRRRRLVPLVIATAVNYLWQFPYAVHQYGSRWTGLPGLSAALVATGVWFAWAVRGFVAGRRGARKMLVAFLAVEVLFYLLHNISGALFADLPLSNPVVLIASVLGYVNLALGACYLWLLLAGDRNSAWWRMPLSRSAWWRRSPEDRPQNGPACGTPETSDVPAGGATATR